MARKNKKGFLPRIEVLIVLVFFLSFIIWAMSKCNAKQTFYEQMAVEETATEETEEQAATDNNVQAPPKTKTDLSAEEANRMGADDGNNANKGNSSQPVETRFATKLYVTIDGLKFRKGPSMDSIVIMTLPLHQELEFMNEVSDSTQQISLGNGVMANERWIKVKHWKGHEGWVYGAGVHYFKPPKQ